MRGTYRYSSGEVAPSLLVAMGLCEPPQGGSPAWLPRALSSVSLMWPLVVMARAIIFCALCGSVLLAWVAGNQVAAASLIGFMLAADAAIMLTPRLPVMRRRAPHIRLRVLIPLIILSALAHALVGRAILFSAQATGEEIPVVFAIVLPATIAVCIFGSQRILSFAYCLATLAPFAPHVQGVMSPLVPLAGLAGLFLAAVMQARADQMHFQERQENILRSEQARALLTDFEEAGQGWFWESDRHGRLTYVSEALTRKLGKSVTDVMDEPVTVLIDQSVEDKVAEGQRTVGFHLSARTAFADISVRAASREEIWWSLSGRPVINEFGQFLGFRGSVADLTAMRRSQAEVTRLARFDSLTGLANRSQMTTLLEQGLATQAGRQGDCALFLLDLDRFKAVNDTMGHPAGDALLRQVAQRLTRTVGNAGTVGRLGGDEFQVVMPGMVDRADLAKLAGAIIQNVSQPYAIESAQVVIGVSVGIALSPFDGTDPDTLVRNADLALYEAKDAGRGVWRFYAREMHADAEDRRKLESDLRLAINTGGLHVEYQPVVSTATEKISGFEALVRWNHPERGAVSPAVFIPIAEEAGLIAQIGEWVLRTACSDAAHWPSGTRVAVNVSPIQFGSAAFPGLVMNALAKSGLAPAQLELEITESVFLDEGTDTDALFAQLKKLGVRLALDDFGTGYSALRYLRSAPFDKIKIDQSFVRGAAIKGSRNGAIVKAIVSLAEALEMETTAEGAETLDELELIRSLGCSHVQGFVYGRPAPQGDVMARFAEDGVYAKPAGFKASRENRRTMLRTIRLFHGARSYDARIRNIATGGALIEGLSDVPPGTLFELSFGGNYGVEVVCRWCSGDRMGVEFATPVQLDRIGSDRPAGESLTAPEGVHRRKVA